MKKKDNILRNFRNALAGSLPLAALAFALPAAAQEAEDILVTAQKQNETQVSHQGSVGVLGDKPASDVPFSIRSYNEALILNQQPQTLGQVLENDPTIRTTFGFGNAAEQFVVRGFVLSGDDVGFDGLYGISPRQLVAPELFEQVQVLNGASAFLNGAAPSGTGLGGSVNLIPKRAGETDLNRVTAGYTSSANFGGSFDVSRRNSSGAWGVRVNGAFRSGDVSIDDEFRQTAVLGGAIDYDSGPLRASLDLGYQRMKVRGLRHKVQLDAGLTAVPDVPNATHNFSQPWTYTTLRDIFGVAKLEYDLADNVLLYASLGARDGSEDGIYGGITVLDADTGDASGSALYVPRTDNNEAGQIGMRVKLAGKFSHEFNIGASGLAQVNRNAYDFLGGFVGFPTNLYNTVDVPLPGTGFVGGDLDNPGPVTRTRLWSVFASDTIGMWEDRVLLTAGLRLQTIIAKAYDYNTGVQYAEYDESAVSPVLGLVVKPVDGLSLFANRIQGLSQGPTAPVTDPNILNPGQVFPPYKSTQYEFGGKWGTDNFNVSLAAFQIEQPLSFVTDGIFGVNGKQRNRGLELTFDGEPVEGLRLIAGGSLTEADLRDTGDASIDGNTAPGVPEYLLNANVEWDLPFLRALTVTGRVVHTGSQWVDKANTLEIPAWTRVDLGARYVLLAAEKPVTLRFNVDNIANERYWASAFDSFGPQLLMGAPRTFKASASIDF